MNIRQGRAAMRRMRTMSIVSAAVMFIATALPVGAQTTDAHIQELIRAAAEAIGAGQAIGAPTAQTTQTASGPTVRLSLEEAVKLALDRNLDIAVQRLNPQTFDFSLASLHANYKPALTSQVVNSSVVNPPLNTLQGVPPGEKGITQSTVTG